VIGFDLDGTLLEYKPGLDYDDELACAALQPHPGAFYKARSIVQVHEVCVITGRGEATRSITQNQVDWIFQRRVPLIMQEVFRGWDVLREFKAVKLVEMGCTHYIGDQDIDQAAARIAQVQFTWAGEWHARAGTGLELPA
jgi:hypothetical protein